MSDKMKNAIKLMVTTGMSQKEIANKIGVEESTISRWKKREDFKVEREKQESEFFRDLKSPALQTLNKLLKAKSEFVRYSTAVYIVDKTNIDYKEKEQLSNKKIETEIKMLEKKIEQIDKGDAGTEDKIRQLHNAITDVISNE
ncbi:phBC6A51 family helix-turn-helix protein [Staphylococcus chromogenes]|uniref:phBC6A51 family helix-turn-helix protein n=1 Tax=Staphylococcus chromogenes TaxID=46126 RepID=UPI0018F8AC4C|nr:phBC6A51 family helix-turn-helix protein [Staphylococcus chromogenes]